MVSASGSSPRRPVPPEAVANPGDLEPRVRANTWEVGDVQPVEPRTRERHVWALELVRASLAIGLFVLFAGTVVWSLALIGSGGWANAREAVQMLLPAETGLLGAAAGFYLAGRRD